MSKASLSALWPRKRIDVLQYTRLILFVILLAAAVDLVLWYFAFNAPAQFRSAFIGAASAWGLAVVAYVATWLQAVTDQVKISRDSRRAAYEKFLSASDDLVVANGRLTRNQSAYDSARDELDAAKRKYESNSTDQHRKARITADVNLKMYSKSLSDASNYAENKKMAYEAVSKEVDRASPRSARLAFEAFRQCPPQESADRADARTRFVKAARDELKLPQRADESTL